MTNTPILAGLFKKAAVFGLITATLAPMGFINIAEAVIFTTRCTTAGVSLCSGLDNSQSIDPFLYYSDSSVLYGSLDTSIRSSGAGSLKFIIPGNSNANSSGGLPRIIDEFGNGFGPGSTFYVQFRQRFSPEMLGSNAATMGGNGWKQVAISSSFAWYGDGNPMSLGLFNRNMSGYPVLYFGDETRYLEQNPADNVRISYYSDQWMTFYLKIHVGTWGQPDSTIEGWIGTETAQFKKVFNYTGVTLYNNPSYPNAGFNKVELTTNNTNKSPAIAHAQASTWFDELIVATQPIADPVDVLPTPTPTPVPGSGGPVVSITSPVSGANINGRILVSVTATDSDGIAGVRFFYDNDTPFGYEDRYSPYGGYFYTSVVSLGQHTIHAVATDRLGNSSRTSVTVNVVPPPDITAPYISSVTINNITPDSATIRWLTNEPANGQIAFCTTYVADCPNQTPLVSDYTTDHVIGLSGLQPNTTYYIWIKSRDAAGNLRTYYRSLKTADVPDVISPVVSFTSPVSGANISGRVLVQAAASDNRKVAGVRFMYDNDVPFGYEDTYAPYSAYLDTSVLALGQHTLHAVVRDTSGNTSRSSVVVNVVPPPDITAPYISGTWIRDITSTSANVTWNTNEPADGQVEYCTFYGRCGTVTPLQSNLTTQHAILITGLSPYTRYYTWIISKDAAGNVRTYARSFMTLR